MLKTRLTEPEIKSLCQHLQVVLTNNKSQLQKAVKQATNDTIDDFEHDFTTINEILRGTAATDFETIYKGRKPKGKTLIILSYNEPLIMCIDPLLSALIAGNELYVRPSSASSQVLKSIWEPMFKALPWLLDRLTLLNTDHENTLRRISSMQAVYFFGSQHIAQKIAVECAQHLVEFWPETEGADFAIYSDTAPMPVASFASYLIREASSHSGQMCQRLQGVFVHESYYEQLKNTLVTQLTTLSSKSFNSPNAQQNELREKYEKLVAQTHGVSYTPAKLATMPTLVSDLGPSSLLCQSAFFLPTLWVIPYSSEETLVRIVADRPIQFGCNIWTADISLTKALSLGTRLTRITVNTNHIEIRHGEGWGGSQPTSFGGNLQWSQKFSNAYGLITDSSN
jgi:acyl-CoA reductase-like NAD-dependent aldehyde dehydrogenase